MKVKIIAKKENSIVIENWGDYEFKLFPGSKSTKPNINFQFLNPKTNKLERVRKLAGLKPGSSLTVLKNEAKLFVSDLKRLLENGWNPIDGTYNDLPITPISSITECMTYWLKQRELMVKNDVLKPKGYKSNQYLMDYFTKWLNARKYQFRKAYSFNKIDISDFLQVTASERQWGKVTYNCYRTDLGTFFNFLVTLKIISESPLQGTTKKDTKKDSSRFKIYEPEELQNSVTLLANDKTYYGLYIASKILYYYNIRPIEMTRIQVYNIDLEKRILTLEPKKTKNGNEAKWHLSDEVFNLLDDLIANQPDDFFVFSHRCKPSPVQVHQDYFGQKWKFFRDKYNISEHLKFYALKHSSDWYDLEDGVGIKTISERNRHSSPNVTIAYVRERLNKNIIQPSMSNKF